MPIEKIKGLRGLKGLDSLSPEERDAFMKANANVLDQYHNLNNRDKAANILYMNQKYINTFGLDAFNLNNDGTENSFNLRNEQTKAELTWKAFKGAYGNDSNFNELATYLDTDGMYDLLNNDEYLGSKKRAQMWNANVKKAKGMQNTFDQMGMNPRIAAMEPGLAAGLQMAKPAVAQSPKLQDDAYAKRDKEILDKLYAESQKRREKEIQGDAGMPICLMQILISRGVLEVG